MDPEESVPFIFSLGWALPAVGDSVFEKISGAL